MSVLFFRAGPAQGGPEGPQAPAGYACEWWRPTTSRVPPGAPPVRYSVWWILHRLRLFANREYAVLLVRQGTRPVHRSAVFPRWLRFPFMGPDDLQVGDTWTEPEHRGRGLAVFALRRIVTDMSRPGRAFWYLVDEVNTASVRAAERAGLRYVGRGERTRRLGLAALGAYRLTEPREG